MNRSITFEQGQDNPDRYKIKKLVNITEYSFRLYDRAGIRTKRLLVESLLSKNEVDQMVHDQSVKVTIV